MLGNRHHLILNINREVWALSFHLRVTISRRKVSYRPFKPLYVGEGGEKQRKFKKFSKKKEKLDRNEKSIIKKKKT